MVEEKVSIIIPVYNAENSLTRTLDSVCNQTYNNIEIILVNDGSKDNSLKICEQFKKTDRRIIIINKKNGGVSRARNDAIRISSGQYIVFADADDYMENNAVEQMMKYHSATGAEYICASYRLLKTRNRILDSTYNEKYYDLQDANNDIVYLSNIIATAPWAKLFCASMEGMPYGEDAVFHFEYLKYVKSVYLTSEILYNYNFTDYASAANRYYKDYYVFLLEIHNAKSLLLTNRVKGTCLNVDINTEKIMFFERCLTHYILYERKKADLIYYIEMSAKVFGITSLDCQYRSLLETGNYNCIILKWKIKNMEKLLKLKINMLFMRFGWL